MTVNEIYVVLVVVSMLTSVLSKNFMQTSKNCFLTILSVKGGHLMVGEIQ